MLIVGTGGHAMDTFDVLYQSGKHTDICFFNNVDPDFRFKAPFFHKYRIISDLAQLSDYFKASPHYILGIGNPGHRELLNDLMKQHGGKPYSLISDKATVGTANNLIESGVNIMHGVVITSNTFIGEGALINTNATLTHDCRVEAYAEIGPGVSVAGACTIKHHAFIGTGAVLIPKITIGEHAVVAAGAVVIKDVAPYTMVAGNPAVVKKNFR